MDTNTLQILDYYRVRNQVAGYCKSAEAKNILENWLPLTDFHSIQERKNKGLEWQLFINSGVKNPLRGWEPIKHLFKPMQIPGNALELEDLYNLGIFCKITKDIKEVFSVNSNSTDHINKNSNQNKTPLLSEIANEIPFLEVAENHIFKIIDEKGELRDLPEIRAIKQNIKKIRNEIESVIKSFTNNVELKDALQSEVPALRQDRQVLAIKANHRGKVKGIVHEVSGSGQTVFIEPDEAVRKNNELIQEEFRLHQEIKRILRELTSSLAEFAEDFKLAEEKMLDLDTSYAVARFGIEANCVFAQTCTGDFQSPILKQARHPLLGKKAIPIDVEFSKEANEGKGHRVLIITGPNTGGKTVTLKTIALFAMLNQTGFPVPAKEGTMLPIFTNVFADIGDEQSLDESLSTFSGHMKNIANALKNADANSLVLLDELGSGTDPQEGGAIAMAVLDELIKKGSFVLVTTHHGILKNYGYTHASCTNASVEFDSETLSPTYRILMGVPGESHALDIAKRNGLPLDICQAASDYITDKKADVSALIKGLNEKHEELANIEAEIRKKEQKVNEKWRKTDLKDLRIKQKEHELREIGYKKSRDFLDESRKMLENLVRELREGEITREKTLKVKETIAKLTEAVEAEKVNLQEEKDLLLKAEAEQADKVSPVSAEAQSSSPVGPLETVTLKPGFQVTFGRNKTLGVLVGKTKNNLWTVQVGSMKFSAKESELTLVSKGPKTGVSVEIDKELPQRATGCNATCSFENFGTDNRVKFGSSVIHSEKPVFELRLLGMRYEEAVKALEHQMDLCAIHNFKSFSVIHGKGNGVLQQAVHECLKKYSNVQEFHFARPEDGGFGKTYVTLV